MEAWSRCCPLVRLLASSVAIAEKAGAIVRQIQGTDLKIFQKGYCDLQTEADRASQRCIVESLRTVFGQSLTINAEEELDETCHNNTTICTDFKADVLKMQEKIDDDLKNIQCKEMVVWVDPLDGTFEFTNGLLDHVTIMIGIAYGGKPVGGVIHQPYSGGDGKSYIEEGRSLWALRTCGVEGDIKLKLPSTEKFVVVTTRSHGTESLERALAALRPDEVVRVGGAGHKALMLLEGYAHAYIFVGGGTKKWDTCAVECLIYEAGGKLTNVTGDNYDYSQEAELNNTGGIIATAPGVNEERRRIAESILKTKISTAAF